MARLNHSYRSDEPSQSSSNGKDVMNTETIEAADSSAQARRQTVPGSNTLRRGASTQPRREESVKPAWLDYGPGKGQQAPTGKCFVIGFDYGATFSGVGYLLVDHAGFRSQTLPQDLIDNVKLVRDYEDQAEYHSKYVAPTVVTYDRSGSDSRPLRWGFPVWQTRRVQDRNLYRIELAKFLFSKHLDTLPEVLTLRRDAKKLRKEDSDFAADFLELLNTRLEDDLRLVYPDYANAPRYYYCGVPAGWSDEKAAFADACDKAGLPGAILVSESEAAANAMLALSNRSLCAGENLLVVDAGGMTVDAQCYTITQIYPPLIRAVTSGEGLTCGSAFLNAAYRQWLMRHHRLLDLNEVARMNTVDKLVDQFEMFKKGFGGLNGPRLVEVFADQSKGRGYSYLCKIKISNSQMKAFFDPSIDEIIDLISLQRSKSRERDHPTQRLLLTGGLAGNPYYVRRIEERFPDLIVERPDPDDVNVPRGIIATGLHQSSVTEARSRFSVGIDERQDYDPGLHGHHEDIHVYIDEHEGGEVVDSISWLLRKDTIIPGASNPIRCKRQRTIALGAPLSAWLFREDIIVTKHEAHNYLDRFQKGSRRRKGQELAADLRQDCDAENPFMIDLRDIPKKKRLSLLHVDSGRPGQGFLTMDYEIVLFFDSGDWIFQFISSADPSVVRSHSYCATSYYHMQTQIGTLVPTATPVSALNGSLDAEGDEDMDMDMDMDNGAADPDDNEEPLSEHPDDAMLSAVQKGKRPAPPAHAETSRRRNRTPLPAPQPRSIGDNMAEKTPTGRARARKRPREGDNTTKNSNEGGKGSKRPRKTSLSVMDPLRHSHPDAELYAMSGGRRHA